MQLLKLASIAIPAIALGGATGWYVRDNRVTSKDQQRAFYERQNTRDDECARLVQLLDPVAEAKRDFANQNSTPIGVGVVRDFGGPEIFYPTTACKSHLPTIDDGDYPKDGKRLHYRGLSGKCGNVAHRFAEKYNEQMSKLAPAKMNAFCGIMNTRTNLAEKLEKKTVRAYSGIM